MEPLHPSVMIDNQVKDLSTVMREQTKPIAKIVHNLLSAEEFKALQGLRRVGVILSGGNVSLRRLPW